MSSDPEPKKKGGLMVPVLALVVGIGGAIGATQLAPVQAILGMAPPAVAVAAEDAPVEYGEFTELDGIVINPQGTDGRRYLMVKIGVEAEEAATLSRLDLLRPAAVDAVISYMAAQPVPRLADIAYRDTLKAEILDRFNTMLGEDGPVTRIYFTQYVLQ